jgi:hypothetical protein
MDRRFVVSNMQDRKTTSRNGTTSRNLHCTWLGTSLLSSHPNRRKHLRRQSPETVYRPAVRAPGAIDGFGLRELLNHFLDVSHGYSPNYGGALIADDVCLPAFDAT